RFQAAETSCDGKPVVALHGAVLVLGDGHGGNRAIRAPVFTHETMRVSKDLVAGSSVERAAFRILDARIVIERGFRCSTRVANTLCARKGLDGRKIRFEIAGGRSELRRVRYSGVGTL